MSALPLLKRVLKPIYAPPLAAVQYMRALRINRAYDAHYNEARSAFTGQMSSEHRSIRALNEVGVRYLTGPEAEPWIRLPPDWDARVRRVASAAAEAFDRTENCLFLPPPDPAVPKPPLTRDVPAVQQGAVISLQLRDATSLPGAEDLAASLLPPIEEHVYGCHLLVDKLYAYRNLVSRQREQVSWLWHYDNHPTPVLKVMVYLTNVDTGRAPFEYVRRHGRGEALIFRPQPLFGNSRVARERVEAYFADGYEAYRAVGPTGTAILFDDNVLHRATLARAEHRDAIVFQVRPTTFRRERYVDSRWTGSFGHVDFNPNPYDSVQHLKRRMLSG